eukprot:6190823-Pleurochrysis_carterae.AAC.4
MPVRARGAGQVVSNVPSSSQHELQPIATRSRAALTKSSGQKMRKTIVDGNANGGGNEKGKQYIL